MPDVGCKYGRQAVLGGSAKAVAGEGDITDVVGTPI